MNFEIDLGALTPRCADCGEHIAIGEECALIMPEVVLLESRGRISIKEVPQLLCKTCRLSKESDG